MLIDLQNVSLRHDDHPILDGVNFHVDDNDFIYIVGKVGSGKVRCSKLFMANCHWLVAKEMY